MQHCGGGPGATTFGQDEASARKDAAHDIFTALVRWVEDSKAPSTIIATKYAETDPAKEPPSQVEMTRPLCPYPQVAKYNGTGNKNLAASFSCATESR
jgi:feruloyl esterase